MKKNQVALQILPGDQLSMTYQEPGGSGFYCSEQWLTYLFTECGGWGGMEGGGISSPVCVQAGLLASFCSQGEGPMKVI